MISAPACYGKLPMLGDYFQSGATQEQANAWWSRFSRTGEMPDPAAAMAEAPWCFVLPPDLLWPGRGHVIGAIRLSRDRIGREFPFVIWQSVGRRNLKSPVLFGKNAVARNWLFWLSRLLAAYTGQGRGAGQASALHFERSLNSLWTAHRSGLGGWLNWRHRLPPPTAYAEIRALLPGETARGVSFMPWDDWPERLWAPEGLCCFWQQDNVGRYLRAFQDRAFGPDTIVRLFSVRSGGPL